MPSGAVLEEGAKFGLQVYVAFGAPFIIWTLIFKRKMAFHCEVNLLPINNWELKIDAIADALSLSTFTNYETTKNLKMLFLSFNFKAKSKLSNKIGSYQIAFGSTNHIVKQLQIIYQLLHIQLGYSGLFHLFLNLT